MNYYSDTFIFYRGLRQILSLLERYTSYVIFTGETCVVVEFTGERCITKLQYINKYNDILST
jgi:hypothetical protein